MTLLDFARGPALQWSLLIFVVGVTWRLLAILLLARRRDHSTPRRTASPWGGVRTVFTRMWPHRDFFAATSFQLLMGYVFHIGLAITVLAFVPHVRFLEGLTGLSWPGLPPNVVALAAGAATLALLVLLGRRFTHPVLRAISDWDDYLSSLITLALLVTGLMAYLHIGPRYETMLAIHILSLDLLLIWFPFGKLMHAFFFIPARIIEGAAFERKGVRA
jgi:nitrate reductase gamma subunit